MNRVNLKLYIDTNQPEAKNPIYFILSRQNLSIQKSLFYQLRKTLSFLIKVFIVLKAKAGRTFYKRHKKIKFILTWSRCLLTKKKSSTEEKHYTEGKYTEKKKNLVETNSLLTFVTDFLS